MCIPQIISYISSVWSCVSCLQGKKILRLEIPVPAMVAAQWLNMWMPHWSMTELWPSHPLSIRRLPLCTDLTKVINRENTKWLRTSLPSIEMYIITTFRFYIISIRMAKINNTNNSCSPANKNVEYGEHFFIACRSGYLYRHYGNQCSRSSKWWKLI